MVFDSHVHWFDLNNNEQWYSSWPPSGDKGLRSTHLPERYYSEADGIISGANHVQVRSQTIFTEIIF